MLKKAILLILVLTSIFPIGCCPEPPSGPYLLQLNQVILLKESFIKQNRQQNISYTFVPNETYTGDTLVLSLNFN